VRDHCLRPPVLRTELCLPRSVSFLTRDGCLSNGYTPCRIHFLPLRLRVMWRSADYGQCRQVDLGRHATYVSVQDWDTACRCLCSPLVLCVNDRTTLLAGKDSNASTTFFSLPASSPGPRRTCFACRQGAQRPSRTRTACPQGTPVNRRTRSPCRQAERVPGGPEVACRQAD
jgi:hypothetical protein